MPTRQDHEGGNFDAPHIRNRLKLGNIAVTLGAEGLIDVDWPPVILVTTTANRTVLLPAEADAKNQMFFIYMLSAFVLTIEEDSSTTAIGTLAQNEGAIYYCDGTTWRRFETDIA